MDKKDLGATLLVRAVDQNLPVKAASAQECRIKDFRPVGRSKQHHPN